MFNLEITFNQQYEGAALTVRPANPREVEMNRETVKWNRNVQDFLANRFHQTLSQKWSSDDIKAMVKGALLKVADGSIAASFEISEEVARNIKFTDNTPS